MKICKKCIQPDTRPGIYFNKDNICGACLWEKEKKKINWNVREKKLLEIANFAKKRTKSNYDCVIGVSGGKDSTVQAIIAKEKLGLRCILVNCEPDNITEIGKKNIENLKHIGFDVITIRPNPLIMKKMIKRDFYKYLNPIKITEYALYSSSYIIADKFDIPLIIQGENPGLTLGTSLTGVGTDSNALKANELNTLSSGWEEYLEIKGIGKKDLYLFHYDRKKLEEKGIKAIWLNYFWKPWSPNGNGKFAIKHGLTCRSDSIDFRSIGTYANYTALDSDLNPVNQMFKYIKFGFGQTMDQACYDLREGRISRKKAIELVKLYDGKCGNEYIEKFCNYIKITQNEMWKTVEKFRGNMWKKNSNGEWRNTYWDYITN